MERQTRQRHAIVSALRRSGRSLSPPELLELAQQDVPSLSLSTVYRQLKALQEDGQVAAVELPGLPARFELPVPAALPCPGDCPADGEHHHDVHGQVSAGPAPVERHRHHFHCTACGEVTPIEGCPGGMDALAPAGWQVQRHDLTLHGRCGKCLDRPHGGAAASAAAGTVPAGGHAHDHGHGHVHGLSHAHAPTR